MLFVDPFERICSTEFVLPESNFPLSENDAKISLFSPIRFWGKSLPPPERLLME
jgi:hypothetical protein